MTKSHRANRDSRPARVGGPVYKIHSFSKVNAPTEWLVVVVALIASLLPRSFTQVWRTELA